MEPGTELSICEFNVENLFISMAYYEGQDLERISEQQWKEMALGQLRKKQKPLRKLWGLSKAILDIDPDILMLAEVGGEESLEAFNRYFLADKYKPFFVEGNAKRGIDLGFLVKKSLHFEAEAHSNRETPVEVNNWEGKMTAFFSRDVAELRLHEEGRLKLILLLVHLKSKITADKDIGGRNLRMGEAFALTGIYEKLRVSYPDVPIILGGDFNADLASLEFELLRQTDLADFHDLLGTEPVERVSLVHFDHGGNPKPQVLDYLLVSPHLRNRIDGARSGTYRYKGFYEIPEELPGTPKERYQMSSDHYPLVLTVRL